MSDSDAQVNGPTARNAFLCGNSALIVEDSLFATLVRESQILRQLQLEDFPKAEAKLQAKLQACRLESCHAATIFDKYGVLRTPNPLLGGRRIAVSQCRLMC